MRIVTKSLVVCLLMFMGVAKANPVNTPADVGSYLTKEFNQRLIAYEAALTECNESTDAASKLEFPLATIDSASLDKDQVLAIVNYFIYANLRTCLKGTDSELIRSLQVLEKHTESAENAITPKLAATVEELILIDKNTLHALVEFNKLPTDLQESLNEVFQNKLHSPLQITNWEAIRERLSHT